MVVTAKDCPQQVYRSVFATLTGDEDLRILLITTPDHPKVYQTMIDYDSPDGAEILKDNQWITMNCTVDIPEDIEQTQDVNSIILDIHTWARTPGGSLVNEIDTRARELLDDGDLSTDRLFCWFCHWNSYYKVFDPIIRAWHVTSSYRLMAMAVQPA